NHLKHILEAAGSSLSKVLKVTVYLTDISHFTTFNTLYSEFFQKPYPARAVIEVSRLPKDVSVEIDAVALAA
ncbi:MAG: deaminase, partial [Candidatus Margulisbacteria bacterium]|nr:deaminase [Candidatus Margulisiibacteriota bacterium]